MGRLAETAILLVVAAGGANAGGEIEPRNPPTIQVCVLDYAGAPEPVLAKARQVTSRIFLRAHVTLDWLPAADPGVNPVSCKGPTGPAVFFLRLVPRTLANRLPTHQTQFGFALLTGGTDYPSNAYAFVDKVREFASAQTIPEAVLLGHVLAHELGHLLLGTNSHSRNGIMQSYWGPKMTHEVYRFGLYFSKAEAKRIQANIEERGMLAARR